MARSTHVILGIAAVLIIAVVLFYLFYLNVVRPSMIGGETDISDTQSHVKGVEFVFDIPVY